MYYVYKREWSSYVENRGVLIVSNNPNRAKGIAMAKMYWNDYPKKDIIVEEITPVSEGVICVTDSILNTTKYN
jgi:hypothetical protein